MADIKLKINNKEYNLSVEPDTPLLWVLRDELGLVGTKYGCGIGQCGACTVHFNGRAIRSCLMPAAGLQGGSITTIEGLSEDGDHPLQEAWVELDVPQCGYCQSGQIMTAAALLQRKPNPTQEEIRRSMHGNICRCAAYNRIEKAVALASEKTSQH